MQTRESINHTIDTGPAKFGVVVIGRNEGQRLVTCLRSVSTAAAVVYVDSNSTDGSVQVARELGAEVIELDPSIPFTAARARNAGFARLLTIIPDVPYVQFVDGDCELASGWPKAAVAFLDCQADAAAVCGRLRERHPDRSVYNWLCDKEWDRPAGEVRAFAGNVMIRAEALKGVGGYREDVIAGEEEELSVRLRQANWRLWRLTDEMALHDAAMLHFSQWWKRSSRAGYAFAQGAYLHGALPERFGVRESCRALVWGFAVPVACVVSAVVFYPMGLMAWLIFPVQLCRLAMKNPGKFDDRIKLSSFQVAARFPELVGALKFYRDHLHGGQPKIIEYK
ncbi:glycosyltransferase involved in cell wall biosynthesis [Bradyrhizobium sp. AZCC 1610]|uniref:glycosyltransferase n=1 Tax=Bradyrhizobium sp. AZCC 1610 TaxID=3117020 RepID=UPI002FF25C49